MKILMVNKFLYPNGGSETYIFELAKVLEAHGHEVQFFGMEDPRNIVGNHAKAYTTNMNFHEGGSRLAKLTYPLKTIYSREARKKIREVLEDFQPDVVHLNNFTYQLTPSILVEIEKWRQGRTHKDGRTCRIIFTAHDYNLICPNHMLYNPNTHEICEKCLGGHYLNCTKGRCIHGSRAKSLVGTLEASYWHQRKIYSCIDTSICCSEFMKTKMDTEPVFAGKTIALHNFIPAASLSSASYMHNESQTAGNVRPYVLYFGRFSKEKGMETLLQAAKELPDIPFVFAGRGPLEDRIRGVENITDAGFQSGPALQKLVREAAFTVYPSEWYENCPYSVMESQTAGTPVVASRIGGIPELVADGRTGLLFAPGKEKELRETIRKLWDNPKEQIRLRNGCRQIQFDDAESYYQKILPIYLGQ